MTTSNAERQKQWRDRMKAEGYRPMMVWLPPEAAEILTRYPEKERGQVILTALRNTPGNDTSNSHVTLPGNDTGNTHVITPGNTPKAPEPSWLHRMAALERKVDDLAHTVQVLVTNNSQVTTPGNTTSNQHRTSPGNGRSVGQREVTAPPKPTRLPLEQRPDLARKVRELKAQGVSVREIARRLDAEHIPTLSGKGKWHDRSVSRLLGD